MNGKGFFTAIVAIIIVTLLAAVANIQTGEIRSKETESSQRGVFELKTGMQLAQQLLDKATADAMSDCYNRLSCSILPECKNAAGQKEYAGKINQYYNTILDSVKESNGLDCKTEGMPASLNSDNVNFEFNLTCTKIMSNGLKAEATKIIYFDKSLTAAMIPQIPPAPDYCAMQVKDNDSGTCDVMVNQTSCT